MFVRGWLYSRYFGNLSNCSHQESAAHIYTRLGSTETDRKILVHLYRSTTGNRWDGYNLNLERWFGVKTNDEGRVVELNLLRNKVKGEKNVTKKLLLVHVYPINRQYVS